MQELRRATKRLAGALMWHLGERIPERITEQTVNLPAPPHTVVSTSIARTTKLAEIPLTLCIDTDVDTPAVMQRQVPQIQTLSTTVEALFNQATKHVQILQTQHIDKVAAMPIVIQRQAPRIQTVLKNVKVPPAQFVGTVVNVPVTMQTMTLVAPQVPSVSDCAEDRESPTGAARERMHEQIVDVPVPQVAIHERILERMHAQIVDVPVPQKMKEGVEPESRDVAACGDATTGPSDSNCDKDGCFPVDQPGDQACRVSAGSAHRQGRRRAGGDATTGPSCSGSIEEALSDGPLPSSAEEQVLRTAMLNPDTRALWENISQLPESDVKDELRQQLCGFIQHRLVLAQTAAAQPSSLPTPATCE